MDPIFAFAIPVLPAPNVSESLRWWCDVCGFEEVFRTDDPLTYAGIRRGPVLLHLAAVQGDELAKAVAEQTMVRIQLLGIDAFHVEFQERGGELHPNGPLRAQPWGGRAFDAIDPGGVCVTFTES